MWDIIALFFQTIELLYNDTVAAASVVMNAQFSRTLRRREINIMESSGAELCF